MIEHQVYRLDGTLDTSTGEVYFEVPSRKYPGTFISVCLPKTTEQHPDDPRRIKRVDNGLWIKWRVLTILTTNRKRNPKKKQVVLL